MDATLLSSAALCADELLERYYRLPVWKALDPTDPAEYLVVVQRLTQALQQAAKGTEKAAMKAALAALDVDWTKLTPGQVTAAVKASNEAFKAVLVKKPPPSMEKEFLASGQGIVEGTKAQTGKKFGFKVETKWSEQDKAIITHAAKTQAHFIRDEHGKRADAQSTLARRIVASGLKDGLDRHAIAKDLQTQLTAQGINRSRAYYTMIAGTFANRSRTYAGLSAMQGGGYTRYQFDAVLDEVTTQQCRFMHGRIFEVKHALDLFAQTAALENPEDVKYTTPWVGYGKNDQGEPSLYVKGPGGVKTQLATVTQSGYGKSDETGKFATKLDGKGLSALGVTMPPLHGNCRSTIVPYDSDPGTASVPAGPAPLVLQPSGTLPPPPATGEVAPLKLPPDTQGGFTFGAAGIGNAPIVLPPPVVVAAPPASMPPPPPPTGLPKKVSPLEAKKKAMAEFTEMLGSLTPGEVLWNPMAAPPDVVENALGAKQALLQQALGQLDQKKYMKWAEVSASAEVVDPAKLKTLIQNGKLLDKEQVVIAKVGKDYFIVAGHEAALASKMLGIQGVKADYVNLDAFAKELKKTPPPKPPPPPVAAAPDLAKLPPPVPGAKPISLPPPKAADVVPPGKADPANILATKTGGPAGHGTKHAAAGFYRGADGVDRYVKVYDNPAQAHGEVLANQVYKALGHAAPDAVTWVHTDGKQAYASVLLKGKTLGEVGLTKENAREFLKGFVGDVLTANWDAAGANLDNAFVMPDGRIARIDNGGSFLTRAQGAPKGDHYLKALTEWEGFFNGTNPAYKKVVDKAGYASPEDFKEDVAKQIDAVLALRNRSGGWGAFVDANAPGFKGADRQKVIDMLEERASLLEKKAVELRRPAPKPGEPHYAPPLNGVAPRKGLKIEDLPEADPDVVLPTGWNRHNAGSKLPSGETVSGYQVRARAAVARINGDARAAVAQFTSSSSSIRRSEVENQTKGTPLSSSAQGIAKTFTSCTSEPGTVYRGNHSWSLADVNRFLHAKDVALGLGHGGVGATSSAAWHPGVSIQSFMGGSDAKGVPHDDPSDYKVLFSIRAKTAVPIETISSVGSGETERLLPAAARYRVVTAAKWKGRKRVLIIELEEV